MFERSMVSSLVKEMEYICGQNNAEKVLEVTISLGVLSGVEEDMLKYWFHDITKGTIADNCKINIQKVGAQVYCQKCDCHSHPPYPLLHCLNCNNTKVELLEGDQITIEDIDLI